MVDKRPKTGAAASAESVSLKKMLMQIPPADLDLFEAVASPYGRQRLRRIRAALAATTQREVDDDALLLKIEMCRRHRPDLSDAGAVRAVVASLPVVGEASSGDNHVKISGRTISALSAERTLTRKFRKRKEDVIRRANGVEAGQALAQRHVVPLIEPRARAVRVSRSRDRTPLETGAPAHREGPVRPLAELSLADASDALLREVRIRLHRPRSD